MQSPQLPYQAAARTAIASKLSSNGYPSAGVVANPADGDGLPYVVLGDDTLTQNSTKSTDGTNLTHTFICWSDSHVEAKTIADLVIQALTDRASPLTVAGHTLIVHSLDVVLPPVRERVPDGERWGVPVRMRAITHE